MDIALDNHRFEVGFEDFADSIKAKVDRVQSLVVAERLFEADEALDAAYREWQLVLNAYSNNPDTTVGFSLAELKRIEYRKTIQLIDDVVDRYASADFNEHAADYNAMLSSIDLSLSLGNFVTVDDKLQDLLVFISENLGSSSNSIKHEVEYDEQTGTWSTSGFLNKENDRRVQLEISVYDPDGDLQIQLLEFSDTKDHRLDMSMRQLQSTSSKDCTWHVSTIIHLRLVTFSIHTRFFFTMWYICLRVKSGCLNAILAAYLDPKSAFINWTSSASFNVRIDSSSLSHSSSENCNHLR